MAHKKAAGSTTNVRDSAGKRLGVKLQDGQYAQVGAILIRQRGTKYHAGKNVGIGKDYTLFATVGGIVKYTTKKIKKFDNHLKLTTFVSIIPQK